MKTLRVTLAPSDAAALDALVAESGVAPNMAIQSAIQSASMQSDAARRASRAYHAKREAAGLKKVTLWLSPEAREVLEDAKSDYGSKDAAADAAIRKLRG